MTADTAGDGGRRFASVARTAANVQVSVHSARRLRRAARRRALRFDDLTDVQKVDLARQVAPDSRDRVANTTTVGLTDWMVDGLDLNSPKPPAVDNLLVGGGATDTDETDRDMNDPLGYSDVAVTRDDGRSLFTATFIDTTEFNGETITEVGLVAGHEDDDADEYLLNHAAGFPSVTKDASRTVTVEGVLTVGAAP